MRSTISSILMLCLLGLCLIGCGQKADTTDASRPGSDSSSSSVSSGGASSSLGNSSGSNSENGDISSDMSSGAATQPDTSAGETTQTEVSKGEEIALAYGGTDAYITVLLSGYLDSDTFEEMGGQYHNVSAGSNCTIIPSGTCQNADIGLIAWAGEGEESDFEAYKLFADGQVETVEEFKQHENKDVVPLLANGDHPAHFTFGENSGEKSALAGKPYSFELKDDGTTYLIMANLFDESGEAKHLCIIPFCVKE